MWLDVHAATHIDRKHIAALLRCSYTVDYIDSVLLDERSSLAVPAIHAFLKTFFPKLASHVLTVQTCSIIDNLVSTLSSMVEMVDLQASAHRLVGDLRALALVYSSGADVKPPASLQPALETLLSRIKSTRTRIKDTNQQEFEAPSKKRKYNVAADDLEEDDEDDEDDEEEEEEEDDEDEEEDEEDDDDEDEEGSASSHGTEEAKEGSDSPLSATAASSVDTTVAVAAATTTTTTTTIASTTTPTTTSSETVTPMLISEEISDEIKEKSKEPEEPVTIKSGEEEKTDQSDAKSSPSLITSSSTTSNVNSQVSRSTNNISWLDMLEKTITNLQVIVQFQSKN